jgi:hypothetical protein
MRPERVTVLRHFGRYTQGMFSHGGNGFTESKHLLTAPDKVRDFSVRACVCEREREGERETSLRGLK